MAKTYAAELLLKNKGLIESLNQSIKKAKDLKKELNNISKDPVKVEAKLGSSFKNVQSNINRIAPKSKTIKIEATEDVTKTINNVNRSMFEMSSKMNSTINSTMKGLNTKLTASIPKLQAMSNTMAAVANSSRLLSSAAGASALAGAGAGIAGAAVLRGRNRGSNLYGTKGMSLAKAQKWYSKKYEPQGIFQSLSSGFKNGLQGDSYNTKLDNKELKVKGKLIFEDSQTTKEFERIAERFSNPKNLRTVDSAFGKIVERQKANMANLGNSNYLSKYQNLQGSNTDFGFFNVSRANKDISLMQKVLDSFKSKVASMQLYAKSLTFSSVYQKMKSGATTTFNAIKRTGLSTYYAIERSAYRVGNVAGKIVKFFGNAWGYVKKSANSSFSQISQSGSNMALRFGSYFIRTGANITRVLRAAFTKVQTSSDGTARRVPRAWVSAAGSIAKTVVSVIGGAFKKLISIASSVAKAVAAAFTAAVAVGIKDMATQEQYITSMTHFISVDDAKTNGSNTITMDQAKGRATGLFNWGTEYANSTPFQNADVYSAINRMTQVFGYGTDGSEVQKMVKLVGDMAALNPSKTMGDAAEAIADLALGETERMKEFGFKISQDELKALAGVPDQSDSLTQDQIMTAFSKMTSSGGALFETFDGGAEALSQTLSGKFSTVMGKLRQMMVDAITPFQSIFKGGLDNLIGFIDGEFKTKFVNAFSTVASFVGDLMLGDSSNFPIIANVINAFDTLRDAVTPVIDTLKEQFGLIYDSASDSFGGIGGIIEGVAGVISNVITGLTPIIELLSPVFNFLKETAIAVWPVIQGVVEVASKMIQDAVGFLTPVIDACTQVMQVIGDSVAEIWPSIQVTIESVWEKLQPVFELFGSLAQLVADVFSLLWPPISGVIETLWSIIGPIFEAMADVLGWIAELCTKVVDGVSDAINAFKDSKWNPFSYFGDGANNPFKQNAYGNNRVPYDGYKTSLHEGERILTSRQAVQMDAGLLPGQGGGTTNTISININGDSDPDTTARIVVQKLKEVLENTTVKSFA